MSLLTASAADDRVAGQARYCVASSPLVFCYIASICSHYKSKELHSNSLRFGPSSDFIEKIWHTAMFMSSKPSMSGMPSLRRHMMQKKWYVASFFCDFDHVFFKHGLFM
ncbi:hypothetical protein GOP47_0023999 [Adiantum capillus-veneris]|uniref:Uncharacterized protein n=1 Tax=Adiantum capillus-veneris TaxID=13818 RepID=A0A9D4Z4Z6_ADICA|nr:hypothetical protein GOP47_0023999 [Adiantum capillus-veneris]